MCLVVCCSTNDKHIPGHAIKPIEHHNEANARNKQIGNKCNRWRPCDALEVVKCTKCLYTSVKNGLSIYATWLSKFWSIWSKKYQELSKFEYGSRFRRYCIANVPHVTGDQLHQEVGPGSEWPPSFKLSFQNIFASDSKSVQILTSHKCVMRSLISLQSSLN